MFGTGSGSNTNGGTHAIVWNLANPVSAVDLHPNFVGDTFQSTSYIQGVTSDGRFWGRGNGPLTNNLLHGIVWTSDNAASAVDMTPTFLGNNSSSFLEGVTVNGVFWGYGYGSATDNNNQGIVWTSASAASAVNMTSAFLGSDASSDIKGVTANGRFYGSGSGNATNDEGRAMVWTSASAASGINLHPSFLGSNSASSVSGATASGVLYGYGTGSNTSDNNHAIVWTTNLATSAVDMTPALLGNDMTSVIEGFTADGKFYGTGKGSNTTDKDHAFVWTSASAASAIDLTPAFLGNDSGSRIVGTTADGGFYGYGSSTGSFNSHAIVWTSASAASGIDLHPDFLGNFSGSQVQGVSPQGSYWGYGAGTLTNGEYHAVVWTSLSAASAVDLTPNFLGDDSTTSIAGVTSNGIFWGRGSGSATNGNNHALVWLTPSADSTIDLTNFTLGADRSSIYGYDEAGGYFYGSAFRVASIWKFVNNEANNDNALSVAENATTYLIGSSFQQNGGFTSIADTGTLVVTDGDAGNGFETFTLSGGTLSGDGTLIGDLNNVGGVVSAGASPGELTIQGDYTQFRSGSLLTEFDGTNAGEFDVLSITGIANLNGTLSLVFAPSFVPLAGTGYDFLVADGGLSGFFTTVNVTGLNGDVSYEIQYLQDGEVGASGSSTGYRVSLAFAAVPETNTGLLALLVLPAVLVLAKRRQG